MVTHPHPHYELTLEELAELRREEERRREAMRALHRKVSGPHCKCAMCVPLPLAQAYQEGLHYRLELGKARRRIAALEKQVKALQPPF